jgi:hypothetical protein
VNKLPYEAPSLTTWGSVSDLTQGLGKTQFTDDFTCTVGEEEFEGSTGHCPGVES